MEPVETWSPNPVAIAPDARTFEANGKTYHKAESISAQRYGWMERLNVELAYGRNPGELFQGHKKAYDLLNKQHFADAAVAIHDQMSGLAKIADGREHAAIRLTMLFWNYEGEEVGKMTEELMQKKVDDVLEAGIDVGFFFTQAVSNAPGLLAAFREHTKGFSQKEG